MNINRLWKAKISPEQNPWTQVPRDEKARQDYYAFRAYNSHIHCIRASQLYTVNLLIKIILYCANPTKESQVRLINFIFSLVITWIIILLQFRFKSSIFIGLPICFVIYVLNCIYVQHLVETEFIDFEKSLNALLDMRQTLMSTYIAISVMCCYNMKIMVFIYSPIFFFGMVYFDYRQKILLNSNFIQPVEDISLFSCCYAALLKCILMCGFYWVVIDRELAVFFESRRIKRQKDNMEQVFHCQKDYVFVLKQDKVDSQDKDASVHNDSTVCANPKRKGLYLDETQAQ